MASNMQARSQRQKPAMRIEAPDATFKSLAALLASTAPSATSHLTLIGASSLSASVTHYLSTLPTNESSRFAQILSTSNAFWSSAENREDFQPSTDAAPAGSSSVHLLSRAQLLFEAVARAVLARIQVTVNQHKGKAGWDTQRAFVAWIRAVADAVHIDTASIPLSCAGVPVSSLAVQTGLAAGLQAARAQRKANEAEPGISSTSNSNVLSTRYALRRAEEEWCTTLTECMQLLQAAQKQEEESQSAADEWEREFRKATDAFSASEDARVQGRRRGLKDPLNDPRVVTLHLAAQIAPYVAPKRLALLPPLSLIDVVADSIIELFESCGITDHLREEVSQDEQGKLTIAATSRTVRKAEVVQSHPLYANLGPLSRLLSLAFAGATTTMSPLQFHTTMMVDDRTPMSRMLQISSSWQTRWLGSRLAGAKDDDIAEASTTHTKQLWTIFKAVLFSFTMIYDALMGAIVDVCPTPSETIALDPSKEQANQRWQAISVSNIPLPYLDAVRCILKTYSNLSWITSTFGTSAFDAYRRVFYEALEVLARDGRASLALAVDLMPSACTFEVNAARRAQATYFLDVVEQLMVQLPDNLVEDVILPASRPYLDDRTYQEAFESAHSVVLSIFATDKECLLELTPYYTRLLLTCFPSSLSVEQLTLAFSTVIDAVSDRSDTMAWYALEQLWRELESENIIASQRIARGEKKDVHTAAVKDAQAASTSTIGAINAGPTDDAALTKRESDLSDVYVAQLQNVNLVLLRSTLNRVKRLIMQRQRGGEARQRLCEKTFASLAGLDASTREEGVRWWLDERERFGV